VLLFRRRTGMTSDCNWLRSASSADGHGSWSGWQRIKVRMVEVLFALRQLSISIWVFLTYHPYRSYFSLSRFRASRLLHRTGRTAKRLSDSRWRRWSNGYQSRSLYGLQLSNGPRHHHLRTSGQTRLRMRRLLRNVRWHVRTDLPVRRWSHVRRHWS
jgi:hypothetical protein